MIIKMKTKMKMKTSGGMLRISMTYVPAISLGRSLRLVRANPMMTPITVAVIKPQTASRIVVNNPSKRTFGTIRPVFGSVLIR